MSEDNASVNIWEIVNYLLNSDEGKKQLEESLVEAGLISWRSKLAAKTLLFIAAKGLCGYGQRSIARADQALKDRFPLYDELSTRLARILQHNMESSQAKTEILNTFLQPSKILRKAEAANLSDGLKTTVRQLELLDLISLGLGDLHISLPLDIDTRDLTPEVLRKPNRLLNPAYQFTPLIGRELELNELRRFRDSTERFSWFVLVGQGGVGKTRLALHFAKESAHQGWYAGFIARGPLARFVRHPGFDHWEPMCDTLIIVDYAATKTESLMDLIEHCARLNVAGKDSPEDPDPRWRVRILLLERHGEVTKDWLEHLLSAAEGVRRHEVRDALAKVRELKTPRLDDRHVAIQEILEAVMQQWCMHAGVPPPILPPLTTEDLGIIEKNTAGRPLFLQMAALEACWRNDVFCIYHWGRGELLQAAVDRELEYVGRESASDRIILLVRRAMALLCLVGPRMATEQDWQSLLREEAKAVGRDEEKPDDISAVIRRVLGGDGEGKKDLLCPLEPDVLGSAFIALVLSDTETSHILRDSLGRALKIGGVEAWSALLRMVRDLYGLQQFKGIEDWPNAMLDYCDISDLLNIVLLLPRCSTVSLNSFAVDLIQRLLVHIPSTEDAHPVRAMWLGALAERLGSLRKYTEALQAAKESVQISEGLSGLDRTAYLQLLTSRLRFLGHLYSKLGRHEQALHALEQVLTYDEELLSLNGDERLPDFANSLNTLGVACQQAGRFEEGVKHLKRAVEIRQCLAAKEEDFNLSDLALSLNDYGVACRELNRHEEALNVLERARQICEKLITLDRDTHLLGLARCMDNLGLSYRAYLRFEEASRILEHARAIYEELVEMDRQAYLSYLTDTMDNLAYCYGDWGHSDKAIIVAEQSLRLHEELVKLDRNTYLSGFARALNNTSTYYKFAERYEDALIATRQAVAFYDELAASNEEIHLAQLAMSLDNFGSIYADFARSKDAFEALERSAGIYEQLAKKNSDVYLPELAVVLNNMSCIYQRFRVFDKALCAATRAVEIREKLAKSNREVYSPALANSLNNLSSVYAETGRFDEALSLAKRVISIREELAKPGDEVFVQGLAQAIANVATICQRAKKFTEAHAASEHLVSAYEKLSELNTEKYKPLLAESLSELALACVRGGRKANALSSSRRAVLLYEQLVDSNEEVFIDQFIENLNILGMLLQLNEHWSEAASVCLRGIRTLHVRFFQDHQTYASTMVSLVDGYHRSCREAGIKIEDSLVKPVIEKLGNVRADAPRESLEAGSPVQNNRRTARGIFVRDTQILRPGREESTMASKVQSLILSARRHSHQRENREARDEFERAKDLADKSGDQVGSFFALVGLVELYTKEGKCKDARKKFKDAFIIQEEVDDPRIRTSMKGICLRMIAPIDLMEGNHKDARENFCAALNILEGEEKTDTNLADRAHCVHNIGTIDMREGEHESAAINLLKSLVMKQKSRDRVGEAATFFQLGVLAQRINEIELGLRLVAICYHIEKGIKHGDAQEDLTELKRTIGELRYPEHEIENILKEGREAYRKDCGLSLVKAAFGDRFRDEIIRSAYEGPDFVTTCQEAGGIDACVARVEADANVLEPRYALGCCYAVDVRYEEALEIFLSILTREKNYGDGKVKNAMVFIFEIMGQSSELSGEYRKKLQMLLY